MKIGIITFHGNINYGANLQAFALQEFLKSLGHTVEIVDFTPSWDIPKVPVSIMSKIFKLINPLSYLRKIKNNIIKKNKIAMFSAFRARYFHLSKSIKYEIKEALDYDAIIFGSDQIWNLSLLKGGHNVYFANFPFKKIP